MSKTWNLDRLYPAIESEAYQQDMKKLKEMVQSFDSFVDEVLKDDSHVVANLEEYVTRMQEYSTLARKLGGYVSLLTSANTNDELATKQMDVIDNILNQSVKAMTKINAWIGRLDLDILCNQSDLLKEHAFVLKEIKEQAKHQLSENEEMIMEMVKKYCSLYKVKARNLTQDHLDMAIEVRVKEEGSLVKGLMGVDNVISASLIAHDGEVTF